MAGPPRRIWLVGMMGSGKSTVGCALAERLGWVAVDTDAVVERRAGKRIATLWHEQGEAAFRALEVGAIAEASASAQSTVISVGGGAVLDPANRARMAASGYVVWLRAEVATLAARIGSGATRPALGDDPLAGVGEVDAARRPFYEQLAAQVVDVDRATPQQVADLIADAFDQPGADPRSVDAAKGDRAGAGWPDLGSEGSVAGRRAHA
jgi:shikimate kinase